MRLHHLNCSDAVEDLQQPGDTEQNGNTCWIRGRICCGAHLLTKQSGHPGPPWPAPARHERDAEESSQNQAAAVVGKPSIRVAANRTLHARYGECNRIVAARHGQWRGHRPTRNRHLNLVCAVCRYLSVDLRALARGWVAVKKCRSADAICVRQSLELTYRFGSRPRAHHCLLGLLAQI